MDATALSDEEFARRGNALFEEHVRPHVDVAEDAHKFVAIDIETGEYAIDESEVEATDRLIERCADAEGRIWLRRVGYEHAHRLGLSTKKGSDRWE
jgi:prophage tail gpP-like protein